MESRLASKTLLVAVNMGLFTLLANHPMSAREIRIALGLHERSVFDFLDTCRIDRVDMKVIQPANEGLDFRAVELLRQFNKLAGKRPGQRRAWLDVVRDFETFMPDDFKMQKMALSAEQSNALRDYFRDDNETALAGSGVDVDDFFPLATHDRPAFLPARDLPRGLLFHVIMGLARKTR